MVDYLNRRVVLKKKLTSSNTWVTDSNAIILPDTSTEKVSLNLGTSRDTFSFKVRNPKDNLYKQTFSGTGSQTIFTLNWSPIPTEHLSGNFQKMFIYVDDNLKEYGTDYTIYEDQLTFLTAPGIGISNVRISYPLIEADDLISIFIWKNSDWDQLTSEEIEAARKIEGTISSLSLAKSSGNVLTVNGYGLIDVIFSGMAFALFDKEVVNRSHLAIQQIISQLNKYNPNRRIYGQDATEWAYLENDTTDESINYNASYKTAIEMIDELSGDSYTGNGQYIYWVEYVGTINDVPIYGFKWKAKTLDVSEDITESIDPSKITIGKSTEDVVNVVIYNAGNDCYGYGQEYINYDFTLSGYGAKWKYVSTTSTIAQSLILSEFKLDTASWTVGDDGEPTGNFPTTFPYTIQGFYGRDSLGHNLGTTLIASTMGQFNTFIRAESKWKGKEATDSLIQRYSNPRYKGKFYIPRSIDKVYKLGDIVTINLPCYAVTDAKLRITDIIHDLKGVEYTVEEDEQTITI